MNTTHVRKLVRGVRHAVDFALLQLHYSSCCFGEQTAAPRVAGLTDDSLLLSLHALRYSCDDFMQDETPSVAHIARSVAALATARSALQEALIWERDDGESTRFMQFTFLSDALRILHERVLKVVEA